MAERRDQRAGVPAPRVQRGRADRGQPVARPGLRPAVHGGLVRSTTRSSSRPRSRSTRPVIHRVGAVGVTRRTLVSRPSRRPPPPPDEQCRPPAGCCGPHRPHHGRPANAEVASDRGHRVGVLADPPTGLSAGSLGQHRPGTDRGRPPAQVPPPQAGSRQRQIRLRQAAPPDSRHWAGRAPGPCAGRELSPRPRPLKSTAVAVVWTASRHSPPATPATRTSSRPRRAAWRPMHSCVDPPGASFLLTSGIRKLGEAPRCCPGGSYIVASSTPPHAS
jgi:hypothetical protein